MMVKQQPIERYNVLLRPLRDMDVERARRWRNAPHVQRAMQFKSYISPEMQREWWMNLSPFTNFYYMILDGENEVGIIHAKDIDWETGIAEAGIFIGNRAYLGSFIPVQAVLAMMDHAWQVFGLKKLKAKVAAKAIQTIEFNQKLGYQVVGEKEDFLYLEVRESEYLAATKKLRILAGKVGN